MIESLERLTLPQAATRLGLHPTDLIRILAAGEGFPPNLRFDPSHLEMIRRRGGLQVWWGEGEGQDSDPLDLSRRLMRRFLEHQLIEPEMTRADNLFRGLGVRPHTLLRKIVNTLIQKGVLVSRMGEFTLMVGLLREQMDNTRSFVETGTGSIGEMIRKT